MLNNLEGLIRVPGSGVRKRERRKASEISTKSMCFQRIRGRANSEPAETEINRDMYSLLKKSRGDALWKTPLLNKKSGSVIPAFSLGGSYFKKEQELFQSQKKHYHSYLAGEQKFDREFLLSTFFKIEANERNEAQSQRRGLQRKKEDAQAHQSLDPVTAQLKALKQRSLEEDLRALGQISDAAFYRFSEKMSLYNDYSTTFVMEPEDLTRGFLKLKKFRLVNWKKTLPMSAYVRRMKTAYAREGEATLSPKLTQNAAAEEREEKEDRLKRNVLDAFNFPKKRKNDKGSSSSREGLSRGRREGGLPAGEAGAAGGRRVDEASDREFAGTQEADGGGKEPVRALQGAETRGGPRAAAPSPQARGFEG